MRTGASLPRLFARADLPMRLIDEPDRLIPLRDQITLVECAVREVGDPTMPVWLSGGAGLAWLGAFGRHVCAAPTLEASIAKTNGFVAAGLQTATELRLVRRGREAIWTYRVTDRLAIGRQTNELLAFGYMTDLVRAFAGRNWKPERVVVPGRPASRGAIECAIGAEIADGEVAGIVMPAELLFVRNPNTHGAPPMEELPPDSDFMAVVSELARTSLLLESRARIDWVARRLGMSRRSLQRALAARGVDFHAVLRGVACREACAMLRAGVRVTDIAGALGYSDTAHFTRAFTAWTGKAPSIWATDAG